MKRHTFKIAGAVFLLAAVLCAPATADRGEVATADVAGDSLYWNVHVGYDGLQLTVAGEGRYVARTFESGETPSFSIFDAEGEPLADGTYKWELVVLPKLKELNPEEFENLRSSVDGTEVRDARAPERQVASGAFSVRGGQIVNPDLTEGPAAGSAGQGNVLSTKDFVINDDLIVTLSACIGNDCVNGETFGFDTLRLKENNTRIRFFDTSVGSFPTVDWEIQANDSANGGQSWLRINDLDNARSPFTIEANTPSHTLYVDSAKRIGIGTSTPVVQLHVKDGNTPTLRLEQDTSSGFTAQTWDVGGNEANFFVRSATTGSQLPFRIRPGAPTSSIDIAANGDVGIGTASPRSKLDVTSGVITIGTEGHTFGERAGAIEDIEARGDRNFILLIDSDNNSTNASFIVAIDGNPNSQVLRIQEDAKLGIGVSSIAAGNDIEHANGARLTTAGVWEDASSRTFKDDIRNLDVDQALRAFASLNPVQFHYKRSPRQEHLGFIAEEVPELVASADRKSLSPMNIVALLTRVGQWQQETIEDQKETLQAQQLLLQQQQDALAALRERVSQLEAER